VWAPPTTRLSLTQDPPGGSPGRPTGEGGRAVAAEPANKRWGKQDASGDVKSFGLKGRECSAQGNALGSQMHPTRAACRAATAPVDVRVAALPHVYPLVTQGVALG